MNSQLNKILSSKYQPITDGNQWKEFLNLLFKDKKKEFYKTPIPLKQDDKKAHEDVSSILEFGDLMLSDDSRIKFYEVTLKDKKQVTSRIALRNIIHADVIPGDVDGIIATYYNPSSSDWRLTFISKSLYWDDEFNEIKSETHPKRYTYVLGEGESTKTAQTQFEWLFNQVRDRDITIEDLVKTFSVEKISNEFFKGYFDLFLDISGYIADNKSALSHFKKHVDNNLKDADQQKEAERLIRHFVKKLLGRIVFLYFLQKKGWMGVAPDGEWGQGQKDFISSHFRDSKIKNSYYKDFLVPLFFDALNTDRRGALKDIFPITQTKIPYLNGGLFEKDKIEPTAIQLKPELFEKLFDFFGQYNFTVDENSPDDKDIGIDPEMLGLIFENLIEDNVKKGNGAFYTPKEVVHFMCKESIATYLITSLKDTCSPEELQEIKTLVFENNKIDLGIIEKLALKLDKLLNEVRICDPAVGSGAFPMGMVYEIFRLKKLLAAFKQDSDFIFIEEKLNIIRQSIYGVDIDRGAVDIARLRFWLSLIVDEREPQPLPNLDYKIMQGDSLRESFENIQLDKMMAVNKPLSQGQPTLGDEFERPQTSLELTTSQQSNIREMVKKYFSLEPLVVKKELHEKIDQEVINYIEQNVRVREAFLNKNLNALEQTYKAAGKDISTMGRGKDAKQYQEWVAEANKIEKQLKRLLKVQESSERPYFLWHLYFDEVLNQNKKGFDIVIGNPPYGGTKIDDTTKELYALGSKDPYGAFIGMALKTLLKDDGVLSYIVSDTWLTIKSHKALREQMLQYSLKNVIRVHQDCFNATVNPCVFTLVKAKSAGKNKVIAADLTNISTRKQVPEFREKLMNLDKYSGQYTPEFAVYDYEQSILSNSSHKPIIVGSPKLFALMNDTSCPKVERDINDEKVEVRQINFNDKSVELVRFGDVADVRQGLATGDNKYYLYQNPEARGNYKNINEHQDFLLKETDLEIIRNDEKIRLKVIEKGIHKTTDEKGFDVDRYFGGRYIAPYDKGGESDTESGWLPNYYVPTNYFIDWSTASVSRMRTKTSAKQKGKIASRLQNTFYCYYEGLTWSDAGIYSPTIRQCSDGPFDVKGSRIISMRLNVQSLNGLLASKLIKYWIKIFNNHTISTQVDDFRILAIPRAIDKRIKEFVNDIIAAQKNNQKYNYLGNEQKEIDKIVYQLYSLNADDINEVETWFARRYPKLADYAYYQKPNELLQEQINTTDAGYKIKDLIAKGESRTVEFKSSLRYCLNQKSPQKYVEHSAFKNLAAFLNTEGGTLFIGVADDGSILGLKDTDFPSFTKSPNADGFRLHFDNLVSSYFGNAMSTKFELEFEQVDGKTIALVHVRDRHNEEVFIKNLKGEEEFYIRRQASVEALTPRETVQYVRENWE